jgi:(p)ppGpp synthase/HD superfamily hydrolase
MSNIVLDAELFATAAHEAIGQKRKYTFEPYIVHPAAVVSLLRKHVPETTDEMFAAAWLHDVIEDTKIEMPTIRREFGSKVADLVYWLTDEKPPGMNRKERKAKTLERFKVAPVEAKTIKLADLHHNGESIYKLDPDFAPVFAREIEELLTVISDGNPTLLRMVKQQLEEFTGIIH